MNPVERVKQEDPYMDGSSIYCDPKECPCMLERGLSHRVTKLERLIKLASAKRIGLRELLIKAGLH